MVSIVNCHYMYDIILLMKKTFKYRLYPTKAQKTVLSKQLEECRWLYNHILEHRKNAWDWYGVSLSCYDQINTIPVLKAARPSLFLVQSQVLQNVVKRVDLAFQSFFRRLKEGTEDPGYPRFRGVDRYDSLTFPQGSVGFSLQGNVLRLFGVGKVSVLVHRNIEGKIKTCTIRRTKTGKWYACFSCDNVAPKRLPKNPLAVGIDMGIKEFLTTSEEEDEVVQNPKYLKQSAKRLAQAQRKAELEKSNPILRNKNKKIVAKLHEKVFHRRNDFHHKTAKRLVEQYGIIVVEDLTTSEMTSEWSSVNHAQYDTAWAGFLSILSNKAAEAGREFLKVNPAYTTQDCSTPGCGHRQHLPLHLRTYNCPKCGVKRDRNRNAARNIKRLGLESLALKSA